MAGERILIVAKNLSYTLCAIAVSIALSITACDSKGLRVTSSGGTGNNTSPANIDSSPDGNVVPAGDSADSSNGLDSSDIACVDTPPVGDGWGWDGTQTCRVGDTSVGLTEIDTNISSIDAASINLLGLLELGPNSNQAGYSSAVFGQLQRTLTGEQLRNFYAPNTDSCRVTLADQNTTEEPQLNVFGDRLPLVSAGDTVMLSSGAGTFATLTSSPGGDGPVYRTDVGSNVARPNGLNVDIPGQVFPAYPGVRVTDAPGLQLVAPAAGQGVDAFSFFNWNRNDSRLSVVEISTVGIGANNQEITIECSMIDDGSFSFPESVRLQMGDNFNDSSTTYARIVYTFARNGDSLLVTANSVFGALR